MANRAIRIMPYRDSHQLNEQDSITESFRDQIIKKASGNFQWVEIVSRLVSDFRRKRYSPKAIQAQIEAIPVELSKLYENLLTSIDDWEKTESLKLMQWICFALEPLSMSELRFAMVLDADTTCQSISQCQESELYMETDEDMEIRVRHLSKGLAEVKSGSTVQLIHESVSDFLIGKKGLELLYGSQDRVSAGTLTGRAHFRLSRSCLKYLSMRELEIKADWESDFRFRSYQDDDFGEFKFPFLRYAVIFWISHSEEVEKEHLSQDDLILYFQSSSLLQTWICAYQCLPKNWKESCPLEGTTLVHIAAEYGFLSVFSALHNRVFEFNHPDSVGRVPLSLAAQNGHKAVVKLLLDRNGVMADFQDKKNRTPLSYAAENGDEAVVKLLLDRNDVMTEHQDDRYWTPLHYAACEGHGAIVRLLLQQTGDVNSQNITGATPLYAAAYNGHEIVVK